MVLKTSKREYFEHIIYLEESDIIILHDKIIATSGGSDGIRDKGLVKAASQRPQMKSFGTDLFPSVFQKAACYFDSIARNHPFVDGNKRTAFVCAARFLYLNGYEFNALDEEVELYVVTAVEKHHTIDEVAEWLKTYSEEI